jgi:hypothetical protein
VDFSEDGSVLGTEAAIRGQMATSEDAQPGIGERDLILGFARGATIGAPGMVMLSKVAPPSTTFSQADLAGPWRVYMQRVESKLAGGTWQVGQTVFTSSGAFSGATLQDVSNASTTLTTGSLTVGADGSVTGTMATAAGGTAHQYAIRGTMRAPKDVITGVVTAQVGTATFQGLVTMVREVTVLGLAQASYAVTEGQVARVTVMRTGNQAGTVTVGYAVTGGTALPGHYALLGTGTLTFGPNVPSKTFEVRATDNLLLDGGRSVVVSLHDPTGGAVLAQSEAMVALLDNDVGGAVRIAGPAAGVLEGGMAVFTLTRAGGTAGSVSVDWATQDGSARSAGADYAATSGTVTFGPRELTKQIQVETLADSAVEGDETVRVVLQNPVGLTLGTPTVATATILDAQQGLQFGTPEYTVTEAMATATITVVRTGPPTGAVTVRWSTSPGSATPGADYGPVGGILTFANNIRIATFTVPIVNDALAEGVETVLLTLSDPSAPAQLGPRFTATLSILDNDTAGVIRLGAATYTVAEGAGTALVTVNRVGTAAGVTVDYATGNPGTATAGADYLITRGTLTFGANETTKTFTIRILNDSRDEPNETLTVTLSNPSGGATIGTPASALVTITDEDVPGTVAFAAAAYTAAETAGVATVIVTRGGGGAGGVTVDYATSDGSATAGSDYTGRSGTLTFNAGEMSKALVISIADDGLREGNETVIVTLSNPGGGAVLGPVRATVLTITDNEIGPTVQFGAAAYSVLENAGSTMITVTRTGSTAADQSVFVRQICSAPPCEGHVNRRVTFAAGQTTIPVTVQVFDNAAGNGDATAVIELSDPVGLSLGAPRVTRVTIRDDDALVQMAASSLTVVEGGTATLTVQRTGATSITSTVRYTTANGSAVAPGDYAAKTGVLTFGPGVTSLPLAITTLNDLLVEGSETFTVTLSQPTGATLGAGIQATVTIQDNDTPSTVQFGAPAFTVLEGGSAAITITRAGGTLGPAAVNFSTSIGGSATGGAAPGPGVDYVTKSVTLTFAAGQTTQTVTVQTVADTLAEGAETVSLALAVPSGGGLTPGAQVTATLTIVDDDQARFQFTVPAVTVAEAAGSVTLTVQRVGPATGNHSVSYTLAGVLATAGADFGAAGGTLLFPPGVTTRTITVPIAADALDEANETFTVTLTGPSPGAGLGVPAVATVTITDDDTAGTVQFAATAYSVGEGGAVTLTVTRTGGMAGPVTVAYTLTPGSALAGSDYVAQSGVLTFAAGEAGQTLTLTTLGDAAVEGSQFLDVVLGATTGGVTLGSPSSTRVWILDQSQTLQFVAASYPVVEGGAVTIPVTRVGVPGGTVGATVALGGTAVADTDYVAPASLTLSFPPGVTTQVLTVQTLPDTILEPGGRTLTLTLTGLTGGAVTGAPSATTIAIVDNERPDLVVTSVSGPVQAATGLPLTVTAVVLNQAGAPAAASRLGVYLEADDGSGPSILLGTLPTPALLPLASTTVTGTVNVPTADALSTIVAPYRLVVVADVMGVVVEANEANNERVGAIGLVIVTLLPDLVVTGVPSPPGTLSGKILSSPLQVRNAGPVASGPYRVGVFLSQSPSSTSGALLLAVRDMPSLPPGAGADIPLSINVPDGVPQGAYYMIGVADLPNVVLESDKANNALPSAVPFQVTRNLTKLSRVTAAFSTAPPSPTCTNALLSGQSIALTGTLALATQTGTTGQGTVTLSGTSAAGPVTFRGPFSATVNADETVNISFTAAVSGAFTGTATATGTGTITGGVLSTSVNGQLTVTAPATLAGTCPFTGPLTAQGDIALFFSLLAFAEGGVLPAAATAPAPGNTTPSFLFPLAITEGSLGVAVLFDPAPPIEPFAVRFTGPAGSGVVNVPADSRLDVTAGSFYETDTAPIAGRNLVGTWSVNYGGRFTRTFTVGNPEQEARFIAMLPTFTLDASRRVTAVSWVFKDRRTGATVPAPPHADSIQVELVGSFSGIGSDPEFGYYASPDFPRTTTTHTLPGLVPFSQINVVYISFKDTLTGNFYVTTYRR